MKIPYIKVKQKGEVFFLTKFNANELKNLVNFHVRDPYVQLDNNSKDKYDEFMMKLKKKGINIVDNEIEVQRRLSLNRIGEIEEFISQGSNFFPNTVLLSIDVTKDENFQEKYLEYESNEIGFFEFNERARFMIIDGQHRLAGIFSADLKTLEELEIPAVILFNVSLSTAAKLFADINGKVKPVNRSLIYDLYEDINEIDYMDIKKVQSICKTFYERPNSPLFRQIKMLGIGNGAISQAFFIDTVGEALKKSGLLDKEKQLIYNQLFFYFKAFQMLFPQDWPVPHYEKFTSNDSFNNYSYEVLKIRRSQLVKTNGFGAIMLLFPLIYKEILNDQKEIEAIKFENYYNKLVGLKNVMKWTSTDNELSGTGKKYQNMLFDKMRYLLDI